MAGPTILVPKPYTKQQRLKGMEAPGKTKGRTAGSWVDDIAAQKKVILLCPLCTNKFNPARVHYRKEKEFPYAVGRCDGCGTQDLRCSWYVYDELYSTVRCSMDERRALAKWREKALAKGSLEWKP